MKNQFGNLEVDPVRFVECLDVVFACLHGDASGELDSVQGPELAYRRMQYKAVRSFLGEVIGEYAVMADQDGGDK